MREKRESRARERRRVKLKVSAPASTESSGSMDRGRKQHPLSAARASREHVKCQSLRGPHFFRRPRAIATHSWLQHPANPQVDGALFPLLKNLDLLSDRHHPLIY
jgi:hypothetical protein